MWWYIRITLIVALVILFLNVFSIYENKILLIIAYCITTLSLLYLLFKNNKKNI